MELPHIIIREVYYSLVKNARDTQDQLGKENYKRYLRTAIASIANLENDIKLLLNESER